MSRRLTTMGMVAAVVAIGTLGYLLGSSAGPDRPAVAVTAVPGDPDVPVVSDPTGRAVPARGTGRDQLTPAEITDALELAAGGDLEVLSVALAEADDTSRRAAVLLYDYATDRLLKRVVDLPGRRVTGEFAATGMQPPATAREIARAADLLWRDPLAAVLRERFRASTGTGLTSPGQLSFEAQTFTAAPGDRGPAAGCGRHRCVTLLPQPPGGQFLDLTDVVVDLSAHTVVRLGA